MAPTRRMAEASLETIPTTRHRRLISSLIRSTGFEDQILCQWALGKSANAKTSRSTTGAGHGPFATSPARWRAKRPW